jgi:SAM-dependent methyltransferase
MKYSEIKFVSPGSLKPLEFDFEKNVFVSPETGDSFPVLRNIPRFVLADNYASSFGLQWNAFRKTQLDSFTGLTISRDRITRISGGSLNIFKDKNVLEAGCGAGRFTEIMLGAEANVWAVDLSDAVEANYENCHNFPNYSVCQANILSLPFEPGQFDIVVCIGVIQHTPNPEKTIEVLCSHVKRGGVLLIDHYTHDYPMSFLRKKLRSFLLGKPQEYRIPFIKRLVACLWPFHRITYAFGRLPILKHVRSFWLKFSPVVDYQGAYPMLNERLLYDWAVLDTHDLMTDYYKHLRSAEELASLLNSLGMVEIVTRYAGNGVEVSAMKPALR